MAMLLLVGAALLLGAIAGFIAGRLTAPKPEPPPMMEEVIRQRRRIHDLTAELQKATKERTDEQVIASKMPIIVKRLGARLSPGAIPGIAVRTVREIFRTPAAGFFAFEKEGEGVCLACGVGFPDDWRGTRRFSSSEGILGAALHQQIVVAKEDYLGGMKSWPLPHGTLEEAGFPPDLVAPVAWGGKTYGALVLCGSEAPLGGKRPYIAMLVDMVASAFQNSIAVQAADLEASTDPLTGLYNRAYFARRFEPELRRAKNYMAPLSVLILDIDHFKRFNDAYGHLAGDVILAKLAEILRKSTRASDFAVRYGGEEFVIVMTTSNQDQSFRFMDRLRETIAATDFPVPGHDAPLKVTISAGISSFPEDGQSTADLLKAADQALYEAKAGGRNRVLRAARIGLDGKPF